MTLEELVTAALEECRQQLTPQDGVWVSDFIVAGEYGLAVDHMVSQLIEYDEKPTLLLIGHVRAARQLMGQDPDF